MIRNIQMVIDESMSGYQRLRHFIVFKSFGIQQPASEPTRSQAHQKRDSEVIVINDGSSDETPHVIDELSRAHSQVRAIHHTVNRGYGGALQSGFDHATKDFVFYTDGDGQYDVREIARLLPLMRPGVDVVNGYKAKRADSFHRVIIGKIYNRVARFLFRLPIRDVDCDFRLIRRKALQRIGKISTSGAACLELIRKLKANGAVFAETEVSHYP